MTRCLGNTGYTEQKKDQSYCSGTKQWVILSMRSAEEVYKYAQIWVGRSQKEQKSDQVPVVMWMWSECRKIEKYQVSDEGMIDLEKSVL